MCEFDRCAILISVFFIRGVVTSEFIKMVFFGKVQQSNSCNPILYTANSKSDFQNWVQPQSTCERCVRQSCTPSPSYPPRSTKPHPCLFCSKCTRKVTRETCRLKATTEKWGAQILLTNLTSHPYSQQAGKRDQGVVVLSHAQHADDLVVERKTPISSLD